MALGMSLRPSRKSVDLAAYARHNVEAEFDVAASTKSKAIKHTDDWLNTLLFPDQLQSRLGAVYRHTREIEKKTGVSPIHLAFSFLEWFESDSSDIAFCSPLLLLPVVLEKNVSKKGQEVFRLGAFDTTPVANLSLEVRLRELHFSLQRFDPEVDFPIECYLASVAETVRPFKRWRIRRFHPCCVQLCPNCYVSGPRCSELGKCRCP